MAGKVKILVILSFSFCFFSSLSMAMDEEVDDVYVPRLTSPVTPPKKEPTSPPTGGDSDTPPSAVSTVPLRSSATGGGETAAAPPPAVTASAASKAPSSAASDAAASAGGIPLQRRVSTLIEKAGDSGFIHVGEESSSSGCCRLCCCGPTHSPASVALGAPLPSASSIIEQRRPSAGGVDASSAAPGKLTTPLITRADDHPAADATSPTAISSTNSAITSADKAIGSRRRQSGDMYLPPSPSGQDGYICCGCVCPCGKGE